MAAPWYARGHHDEELEYASNSKEPVLPPPRLLYHAADIANSGPAIGIYTKEADKHVRIRFSVQKIVEVNLMNQTFTADLHLEASWEDHELKRRRFFDASGAPLNNIIQTLNPDIQRYRDIDEGTLCVTEFPNERFFAPRLFIPNLRETLDEEVSFQIYDDCPENMEKEIVVCLQWQLKGVFTETMELQNFPFDLQPLSVTVQTSWPAPGPLLRLCGKMTCSEVFDKKTDIRIIDNIKDRITQIVSTICIGFQASSISIDIVSSESAKSVCILLDVPSENAVEAVAVRLFKRLEQMLNDEWKERHVQFMLETWDTLSQPRAAPSKQWTVALSENLNKKYKSKVNLKGFHLTQEYDLVDTVVLKRERTSPDDSNSSNIHEQVKMSVVLKRRVAFWVYNIVVPMTLFSAVSFSAFSIPSEELGDRASVTLTIMLTNVAYKYMVADKLPSVNYLTVLDKYSYFSFMFLFIVAYENALAAEYSWVSDNEEFICRILVGMWACCCFCFLAQAIRLRTRISQTISVLSPDKDVIWIGPLCAVQDEAALATAVEEELLTQQIKPVAMAIWQADEAHAECLKYEGEGVPSYQGKSRFGVIKLATEDEAIQAIKHLDLIHLDLIQASFVPTGELDPKLRDTWKAASRHWSWSRDYGENMIRAEPLAEDWRVLLKKPNDVGYQAFQKQQRLRRSNKAWLFDHSNLADLRCDCCSKNKMMLATKLF